MSRISITYWLLSLGVVLLLGLSVAWGAVDIPLEKVISILMGDNQDSILHSIIFDSRIPQSIAALLCGAALAVSGLILQTLFRNPLASPSILGISSGASLGSALVIMALGGRVGSLALGGSFAVVFGAFVGAMAVLVLLLMFTTLVRGTVMLLVVGLMIGYLASSVSSLLSYYSSSDSVVSYVVWGMGDFTGVTLDSLPFFSLFLIIGIVASIAMIKPLNALLIGDRYSSNLGLNIVLVRFVVLLTAGLLTAVVTAFCGPIAFIGMATPHIARMILKTTDHRRLLPVTLLMGSAIALVCNIISSSLLNGKIIPLNVITPLMGAPVVIYIIVGRNKMQYFS